MSKVWVGDAARPTYRHAPPVGSRAFCIFQGRRNLAIRGESEDGEGVEPLPLLPSLRDGGGVMREVELPV